MPTIRNVTNIELTSDNNGSSIIKLYLFKDNLQQLLLVSNNIWNQILQNKSTANNYNIFNLSIQNLTKIQLKTNYTNISTIKKILVQKSNVYNNYEEGYTSFNIIGYYLENNSKWISLSDFYKGQNYNNLSIISGFNGNVITKANVKKILFKLKFTSQIENNSIDIDRLIYFSKKRYIFGYTNDVKTDIKCFPLIRPSPEIIVSHRNSSKDNFHNIEFNLKQMLYFDNNTTFKILPVSYNESINVQSINTRTLRTTNIVEETSDISEFIHLKFTTTGINKEYYNIDYTLLSPNYNLQLNIISIKFKNNYEETINNTLDNTILINKHTNKTIETIKNNMDNGVKKILSWGNELPLYTHNSYLQQKIVGIQLNDFNNSEYSDLNYELLIINNNTTIIDVYIQNNSSNGVKRLLTNKDTFGNIDYNNNLLEIIPKAKDNVDGRKGLISYNILQSNYDIFKNLIIPNTIVEIAGVKTIYNDNGVQRNLNKLIINLNINNGLSYSSYSKNILFTTIDNTKYSKIVIEDEGTSYSGKNPIIKAIDQTLTLKYKVYYNDISGVKFERQSIFDNSIDGLTVNDVVITNMSDYNPTFKAKTAETYYFDMSHISNKGKTIRFYKDNIGINELSDNNELLYAQYSRNYEPGEVGSFVSIVIPKKDDITSTIDGTPTIGSFFYILKNTNSTNVETINHKGRIDIQGRALLNHGEITIDPIENNNNVITNGIFNYSNDQFYNPESTKPIIDLSLNNSTASPPYIFDYFNTYQYLNSDISGQIDISSINVKSFTGDNIILIDNTFDKMDYKFYFKNTNLIHGNLKIGFSSITNSDLFTTDRSNENINGTIENTKAINDDGRYLRTLPNDVSNIEQNGYINEKNDTDYIVYMTRHFTGKYAPQKADYLIKYIPDTSDYRYNQDVSYNMFITGGAYNDLSQNIYLCGHNKTNTYLNVCLVVIKENEVTKTIERFEKIPNSDVSGGSLGDPSGTILTEYRNGLYTLSTSIVPRISVAFARKKFQFLANMTGSDISGNGDIFMFEPIDASNNVLNHDLSENKYLVGVFDNSNNENKIKFSQVKLKQEAPFYEYISGSNKDLSNTDLSAAYINGDYGLYEATASEIIEKYNSATTPTNNNWSLTNFKLPLFDSNKYNDFTVEIQYRNCWGEGNGTITCNINKKKGNSYNTIDNSYNTIDTITYTNSTAQNEFNQLLNNRVHIQIDASGNFQFMDISSSAIKDVISYNVGKTDYKVTYQIENLLTNNNLNDLKSNKLVNYKNNILTTTVNGKTILNIKNLFTPLKLHDSASDPSKNEFNTFMNTSNPTGEILNTIINKQTPIKIENIQYEDTDLSGDILTNVGIGYIDYKTKEYINNVYDASGSYSGISGESIYFNVVDVKQLYNLKSEIKNEKNVYLSWDFKNENLSVGIRFKIYRAQNTSGQLNYTLIATTTDTNYMDERAIPYILVYYKVESVVVWENEELVIGTSETNNFICENNAFGYGRYNNTTKNQKLYQPINSSCQASNGIINDCQATCGKLTGNLFPNSQVLTKAQIYSTLSRAKFRPFR